VSDVVDPQKESRAKGVFEGVQAGFRDLQNAHINYQHALEIAADTDLGSDGMIAIRQLGRAYADAVIRHSDAVMAWLAAVDTNRVPLKGKRVGV
jgi:hypothetical protein